MNANENGCVCEMVNAADTLCGFCAEMLYASQQEVRVAALDELLTNCYDDVKELQQDAVTTAQLEETVESELDRMIERGQVINDDGCQEMIDSTLRDFKGDIEDDISEGVSEALRDYINEDDTLREIRRALATERREIDEEAAEIRSQLVAFQAAQPSTVFERLRWLLTGRAR
jgi:hypothetical protein